MIDTLSLLLSHFLLGIVALRMWLHPYLNAERAQSDRHFKQILPQRKLRKRAGVETGEARPGSKGA